MSRIRFSNTTEPAIPPTSKSWLYTDEIDGHLKRKLETGNIIDYDAGVSTEAIQDAIGSALSDTSTIDLTYNDAGNTITADIVPSSINNTHVDKISPLKIQDDQNKFYEANVITNDNTPNTILTLDASMESSIFVELKFVGRRIGGLAGNPGDAAIIKRSLRIKSIGGSVTLHDLQSDYTSKDNSNYNIGISVSGTDVNFQVIGDINNNIKWVLNLASCTNGL